MKLTYEALLDDPTILDRIEAQARRERAEAVHEVIVAPLARILADNDRGRGASSVSRMRASPSRSPHVQGRPAQG
jgi:hypothetical protein